MSWRQKFSERQLKEIEFSIVYVKEFKHGTDGHSTKMIIAKMADMLDQINYALAPIGGRGKYAERTKEEIVEIMGYSVRLDDSLDSSIIEFRNGDTLVGKITNLDADS